MENRRGPDLGGPFQSKKHAFPMHNEKANVYVMMVSHHERKIGELIIMERNEYAIDIDCMTQ